jgi:hypothetical protein
LSAAKSHTALYRLFSCGKSGKKMQSEDPMWLKNKSLMGRHQKGVHFGNVSLKKGEESSKFLVAKFLHYFFLVLFLNNSVIFLHLKTKAKIIF